MLAAQTFFKQLHCRLNSLQQNALWLLTLLASTIVKAYQVLISPVLGPRCRFFPCCSAYFLECLKLYSLNDALGRSFRRILKCHPFHPGGVDLP